MTSNRADRKRTSRSPRKSSRAKRPLRRAPRSQAMVEKRPALGRGLSALIPDAPAPPAPASDRGLEVDTDLLHPNKFQPRTTVEDRKSTRLNSSHVSESRM